MVDMSRLKRRSSLPPPPPMDEASANLEAPEHAPATQITLTKRIDGRSARRSNRTVQFATRVTAEFDDRIRAVAARDGLLLVEVMERALDAYEAAG